MCRVRGPWPSECDGDPGWGTSCNRTSILLRGQLRSGSMCMRCSSRRQAATRNDVAGRAISLPPYIGSVSYIGFSSVRIGATAVARQLGPLELAVRAPRKRDRSGSSQFGEDRWGQLVDDHPRIELAPCARSTALAGRRVSVTSCRGARRAAHESYDGAHDGTEGLAASHRGARPACSPDPHPRRGMRCA